MENVEDENDFEPYDHRDKPVEKLTKSWQTLMNFIKASMGTGILAMHVAYSNSGTLVGIIGCISLTLIVLYCMHLIIRSEYQLCKKKRVGLLTFADAVQYAFEIGPKPMRKFARIGFYAVDIFILIQHIGGSACYMIFIAGNFKQFLEFYIDGEYDVRWYCCLFFTPLLLLNMIRNYRFLAPFATVANVVTIIGLGFIMSFVFTDMPAFSSRPLYVEIQKFPMFIGTILFALISIGLVTSLENSMLYPADYIKPFGVLNIAYFIIGVLYMSVGLLGYIKYGYKDALQGSITMDLPSDDVMAQCVKLCFAMAILVSQPLFTYVAVEIGMEKYIKPQRNILLTEYLLRVSIVILIVILAVAVPMLAQFISLIGAFALSAMAFIFPPLMDICVCWPDKLGKCNWILVKDCLIIIFGLLSMILGTYTCMLDIYNEFTK